MAAISEPRQPVAAAPSAAQEDYAFVMQHCAIKGVQSFALLAPPLVTIAAIRKGRFSVGRILSRSAIYTFPGGAAFGLLAGWGRMRDMADDGIADRALRLRFNASQIKCDDFTKVGSILGALATTTLFYRRSSLLYTIPGGAALGIAGGVIAHLIVNKSDGRPNAMVEELKSSYPLKRDVEQVQQGEAEKLIKGQ